MNHIKKMQYRLFLIILLCMFFVKKAVYANPIAIPSEITKINYAPSFYIAIGISIIFVAGISILVLRRIYKNNQVENKDDKGVEK